MYKRRLSALNAVAMLAMTGGFAAAGATLATAAHADGTCSQFVVSGNWAVHQSNIPNDPFSFSLSQTGTAVSGSATYTDSGQVVTGIVSGSVSGSNFDVNITWSNGPTGNYTATVTPTQLSNGNTFDVANPSVSASWSADGTATCAPSTPGSKDQCKNGGWTSYVDASGNPFKNQGDCVSFVASNGKSDPHSA